MATKIEWTDKVWQPMHGCTKVSSACVHCYAEVMARRLQGNHIKSYENGGALVVPEMLPPMHGDISRIKLPWDK